MDHREIYTTLNKKDMYFLNSFIITAFHNYAFIKKYRKLIILILYGKFKCD